ncbi:hypothetical protein HELRODRAFT_177176 [Helobdella robusta]|uniref:Ephrin RBD domain-containing protein n=1 Tax=Helobdella robusta TaxID=6412 RepID=T1FBB7_HELRO|nr:hypothetical protein HELRODRAFT_177176 [Helobdella robusta]ESN98294.1 hypothetical protein HELRODRAFT_177176 [Helobdella robusta]
MAFVLLTMIMMMLVSENDYRNCIMYNEREALLVLNCSHPYSKRRYTILFESYPSIPNAPEYKTGESYYFITTSTGNHHGLNNVYHGACRQHNMRIKIKVSDRLPNIFYDDEEDNGDEDDDDDDDDEDYNEEDDDNDEGDASYGGKRNKNDDDDPFGTTMKITTATVTVKSNVHNISRPPPAKKVGEGGGRGQHKQKHQHQHQQRRMQITKAPTFIDNGYIFNFNDDDDDGGDRGDNNRVIKRPNSNYHTQLKCLTADSHFPERQGAT